MFIKYLGQPDIIMFIGVIFIRDVAQKNEISSGFLLSFPFLKDNKYSVGRKNQKNHYFGFQSIPDLMVNPDLGP